MNQKKMSIFEGIIICYLLIFAYFSSMNTIYNIIVVYWCKTTYYYINEFWNFSSFLLYFRNYNEESICKRFLSLSEKKLYTLRVRDPKTMFDEYRKYIIYKINFSKNHPNLIPNNKTVILGIQNPNTNGAYL